MKLIAFALFTALSSVAYAVECPPPSAQEKDGITITPDADQTSGMYHVRVPREYEGKELRLLVLTASTKGSEEGEEISLPLAIKTKGELTGSYFHMPTNWLNIRVEASYGEDFCTTLLGRLSM